MATSKKRKDQEKLKNSTNTCSVDDVEILDNKQVPSTNEKPIILANLFSKAKAVFEKDSPFFITGLLLFFSFLFYPLGYSILYGYYFGKDASTIKLMDVFLSQIPFSFNFIVIMGISSLAFILFFYASIHLFFFVDSITEKSIFIFIHWFTIFLIYVAFDILGGLRNTPSSKSVIMGLLLLSGILWIFLLITKSLIPTDGRIFILLRNAFILALWALFVFIIYMKTPSVFYDITFADIIVYFCTILVIVLLDYLIFNKRYELYKFKMLLVSILRYAPPLVAFWIAVNIKSFGLIVAIIITACSICLAVMEYRHLYNKNPERKKKEGNPTESVAPKVHNKTQNVILGFIIVPFLAVLSIIAYLIVCHIMAFLGFAAGQSITLSSASLVKYHSPYTNQYSEITGVIVARKGDTLYISSEDRQLVVITSSNIIIEPSSAIDK